MLRRRAERAEAELAKATRVIEVQGNVSALLEQLLETEGASEEHRAMIEQTVEELTPIVGTRPACRALGASSATIYRRRRPPEPRPRRPRPAPAGRSSEPERERCSVVLHSERFVDSSPAQVWATLLDEGRYLCSERTMYRLLAASTAGCASDATSSPTPPTPGRSCSPSGRTSSGRGTSPSSRGRRSGPASTCT